MNTPEFISHLRRLRVTLAAEGDRLRCNGPPGVLTPELRREIARRKDDILSVIRAAPRHTPPIRKIPRGGPLPLSFSQERLWILDRFVQAHYPYKTQVGFRLTGELDTAALKRSLDEIIAHHEILRTTFSLHEGEPVQAIADSVPVDLPVEDLACLSPSERESAARGLQKSEAGRPFDLSRLPLLRPLLVRLGETEHVLLITIHHIIFDAWSVGILCGELEALYTGFVTGSPASLPDLPIQYADFAAWQRERLRGDRLERYLSYWQEQLDGAPVLRLPADHARPAALSFQGAHRFFEIPRSVADSLVLLSRDENSTLFMVLLAAFTVLLHRYSNQDDIVVGTPVAGRNRSELEGLIGFFINTLVLRIDCSGDPRFRSLIGTVRDVTIGALDNQDVPFEKLVEELRPERDTSHNPLFQVMFVFQNVPAHDFTLPGLTIEPFPTELETVPFDLALTMVAAETGIQGMIGYSTDLFEADTIDRMAEHLTTLLTGIVENPDRRISTIPILTGAQRRRHLAEWNSPLDRYEKDITIYDLFRSRARLNPDRIAVVSANGSLSYGGLERRASRLAERLGSRGIGPEVPVGIYMDRSAEMITAVLAVFAAGGAYVPLDTTFPAERVAYMIEDSGTAIILTLDRLRPGLPETEARVITIDADGLNIDERDADEEAGEPPPAGAHPSNLAYIIYTSGSTGRPKGVLIEHRGLCNLAEALIESYGITHEERILQFASTSFDASIAEIVRALIAGGSLHIADIDSLLPGQPLTDTLRTREITMVTLPPSILSAVPAAELPALRTLITAGEACPPDLVAAWADGRAIINAYGPTEATVCSTFMEWHAHGKASESISMQSDRRSATVPIGKPLANTQAFVLDRALEPVPAGVIGEVHVGGSGLGRGYLNRPGLTAERFIPHPYSIFPGERLYRTGDTARFRPDGTIEFVGRIDNQVKIRGFRVEPGEIEAALREHADIRECVVDASIGKGEMHLIAYYVSAETIPSLALRRFLRERLPGYMVPMEFIHIDGIPLTASGKTDHARLRDMRGLLDDAARTFIPPQSDTERAVAAIWSDVLGVRNIGLNDNFFDLGGYSLLVVKAVARMEEELGVTPKVGDFIRLTLGQMAGICEAETKVKGG